MAQINRQSGSDSSLPSAALPASGSRGLQRSFAYELFRPFLCGQQNWSWTLSHPAPPQSFTRSYGSKSRSQRVKELSVIRYWLFVRRSQPPRPPLHLTLPSFVSFVISVVKFYFAAVSCFTFVWKIAIQAPFSCFQTEPAL